MSISTTFLWIVFLSTALLFAGYGLVLVFHWIKYSLNPAAASIAIIVYVTGGLVLLGAMIISIGALLL